MSTILDEVIAEAVEAAAELNKMADTMAHIQNRLEVANRANEEMGYEGPEVVPLLEAETFFGKMTAVMDASKNQVSDAAAKLGKVKGGGK